MARRGVARTRHLRKRSEDRFRHSEVPNRFWDGEATRLEPTETFQTFTADNATNQLTAVAHGYVTASGPVEVENTGGALPTGLEEGVLYFTVRVTDDVFQLARSREQAVAGDVVEFSDNGSGTNQVYRSADRSAIFEQNRVTTDQEEKPEKIAAAADIDDLN